MITTCPDGSLEISSKDRIRLHLTVLISDEPNDEFDPDDIFINLSNITGEMLTLNIDEIPDFIAAFNSLAAQAREYRPKDQPQNHEPEH